MIVGTIDKTSNSLQGKCGGELDGIKRKGQVNGMACELRDAAREKFSNSGFSYLVITQEHLAALVRYLQLELARYLVNGGEHAIQMNMSVAKVRKTDFKFTSAGLKYAQIEIDGSYFKRREGITFSQTGFIGFGNEFSDCNVKPILDAFEKWCDYLKESGGKA